jgi:hypothetical protein
MLHLLDLPPELLEEILFYLPPTQLILRVSATCRRLRTLLRSDSFWKRRYAALVCATPPSREEQEASVWQRGCVEAQFSRHLGRNTVTTTTLRGPTGGVDCVHLMFPEAHGSVGLVAAGCRDSSIFLWRRRGHGAEEGSRSMRGNIVYRMEGHVVRKGLNVDEAKGLNVDPNIIPSGEFTTNNIVGNNMVAKRRKRPTNNLP